MPAISRFNATAARAFGFGTSGRNSPDVIELLVVGGGASGAYGTGAGGGGGGQFIENLSYSVTPNFSYTVTVGAGGSARTSRTRGVNGGSSVFGTETAIGGGGGSYTYATFGFTEGLTGLSGASSGGGAISFATAPAGNYYATERDAGTATAGNVGQTLGSIFDYGTAPGYFAGNGGGGGGAGTAASGASRVYDPGTGITTITFGSGGDGLQSSITGVSTYYAGGGRGYAYVDNPNTATVAGTNGLGGGSTANRGGGGNGNWGTSGAGGSGVVIIAYPDTYDDPIITGATYTKDTVTRAGYKVFTFTAGTGSVLWR